MDDGSLETKSTKNQKRNLSISIPVFVLILVLFIGAAFFVGRTVGRFDAYSKLPPPTLTNTESDSIISADFGVFWQAWNALNEKFVSASTTENVSDQDKIWGAISGLTESFGDPYTQFFPPAESKVFEENISGNFSGVGIEIGIQSGLLTVIAPLKNTPADRAGIRAGDKIIKIDDVISQNISIDEAVDLIRGERGTSVKLTLVRDGVEDPIEVDVVRDIISIPTLETKLLDDENIFVISLFNFSATSAEQFREALQEFIKSGSNKLLLDLRGNAGGYLDASISMASWFLPEGKIVVTEDFGNGEADQIHRSRGYDIFREGELKMVILIDQGSASASEILAGALQEHNIATLLGTRSFGKGSVQELLKLTPDTSLKITIARWLTPEGNSISDGGLTPDVEAEFDLEAFEEGRDTQFERAIEVLGDL